MGKPTGRLIRQLGLCFLAIWLMGCATVGPLEPTAVAAISETVPATAVIRTPTPITPSATPTPSATATAVPTETAAPTHTPTATPTETATETATPTITPTPSLTPVPVVPIGQLPSLSGQRAAVVGQVTAVASFSRGYRFTLRDDSGQVTLLMWDNVYDDCWDAPQINLGASVWALGEVGYFDGQLQLVPSFGGHVKIRSAAHAPPAPAAIASLGDRIGQRVTVVGQILRVDSNNNGYTLQLGDDGGEIAIFIWHNSYNRIPNRAALTVGARVRVVGPVSTFRDALQIVPVLPYDVVSLP